MLPPLVDAVERLLAGRREKRRNGDARGGEPLGKPCRADPVDEFEGPPFPGVAEPHRLVDRHDVGGRLGDEARGIGQHAAEHGPGVATGLAVAAEQLAEVLVGAGEIGQVHGQRRAIGTGGEVDRLLVLAAAASIETIEAALALAADGALGDHAVDERHVADGRMERIVLAQGRAEARRDMRHEVEADEVDQSEDAGLGNAHRPSHDGIGLLDREAAVHRFQHAELQPVDAEAVGDEARAVLAGDNGFTQNDIAEPDDARQDGRVGLGARDDFEQPHVARRIEEMRDEEIPREGIGQAVDEMRERDRRGIRGYRRAGPAHRFDPAIQGLLDVEPFDDDLDDPIAVGHAGEIVLDVADADEFRGALRHEGRGIGLA